MTAPARGVVNLFPYGVRAVTETAGPMVPGRRLSVVPLQPLGGQGWSNPIATGAAVHGADQPSASQPKGCGGC